MLPVTAHIGHSSTLRTCSETNLMDGETVKVKINYVILYNSERVRHLRETDCLHLQDVP
jgi:hypothetical protein